VQPSVLGLVDDTHPSTAELLDDAVVRDGLADHRRRSLRLWTRQVNESRGVGARAERLTHASVQVSEFAVNLSL